MKDEDFRFLIMRNQENGLVFVALDSIVGYIRHLSQELANASHISEDPASTSVISHAFSLLSDRLEEMEEEGGAGRIADI
jgi:hypothetical protein